VRVISPLTTRVTVPVLTEIGPVQPNEAQPLPDAGKRKSE
jgi:hypothetical protein